jgi:hypothetical protein
MSGELRLRAEVSRAAAGARAVVHRRRPGFRVAAAAAAAAAVELSKSQRTVRAMYQPSGRNQPT